MNIFRTFDAILANPIKTGRRSIKPSFHILAVDIEDYNEDVYGTPCPFTSLNDDN